MRGTAAGQVVRRAAAISATFDLVVTGAALARGFSLNYARHFLAHDLRWKALRRLMRFPGNGRRLETGTQQTRAER